MRRARFRQQVSAGVRLHGSWQELEAYLAEREQRAQEVRQRIERHQGDLADLRRRILARQQSG